MVKIPNLDEVLELVTEKKSIEEAVRVSPFRTLAEDKQHRLYLGKDFNGHRNQYWRGSDGKYILDYYNFFQIASGLVSGVSTYVHGTKVHIKTYVASLSNILGEIMLMHEQQKIDKSGQNLGISNKDVHKDFKELADKAFPLHIQASSDRTYSPDFLRDAKDFIDTYKRLKAKYERIGNPPIR